MSRWYDSLLVLHEYFWQALGKPERGTDVTHVDIRTMGVDTLFVGKCTGRRACLELTTREKKLFGDIKLMRKQITSINVGLVCDTEWSISFLSLSCLF